MKSKDTSKLTREQLEELLADTEALKAAQQATAIQRYNNPEFIGEHKVHRIQQSFHKDPKKIRLFLGGNRCLLAESLIMGPNARKTPIAALKPGDVVLAVDPDTLDTAPVPIEAVYDNGVRIVESFIREKNSVVVREQIFCTPEHLILTSGRGLVAAGQIKEHEETAQPNAITFVGESDPFARATGHILDDLFIENNRPYLKTGTSSYKAVKALVLAGVGGFIKKDPTKDRRHNVYGAFAKYLVDNCRDKGVYLGRSLLNWDTESVRQFLKGYLPRKMKFSQGIWHIVTRATPEMNFILQALTAVGIFTRSIGYSKDHYGYVIILDSAADVLRLSERVGLGKLNAKLRSWAVPRVKYIQASETVLLKQESFWRSKGYASKHRFAGHTYDIKLAGGHNLFIADNFVVSNSGKTEAGAVEAYWFASGTHPYKDIKVPNNGRILVESLELLEQDIVPKFKRWAPNFDKWETIKGHQGKVSGWKLPNGSRIDVFTFNQESAKLEGTSIRWLWANEPPPQNHVIASLRGLVDQDGDCWMTLTPLSEPYLYNEFYIPATTGVRTDVGLHTATIHDNPWLDKRAVERFLQGLSPDERAARERGVFKFLTGRVFKEFDTNIHVIPTADWPTQFPVTIGIDPHLRKNHVAMFLGMTRKGWYVAIDEVSCSGDLEEFANQIVEKVIERGFQVQEIVADTFISQPDIIRRDVEPKKVLDNVFRAVGLPSIKLADKKNSRQPFISEMRRLLKSVDWPQLDRGQDGRVFHGPSFYVMNCCQGLIADFMNYVYKTANRPELTGPSEDPIKKFDDYLDALKYALFADPRVQSAARNLLKSNISLETYGISTYEGTK